MKSENLHLRVCIVVASLKAGGMERVATTTANHFAESLGWSVYLVQLNPTEPFFPVNSKVILCSPENEYGSFTSKVKGVLKLRRHIKSLNPDLVISFGSMYNSYVLASLYKTGIPIYISDRSNPYRNTYFRIRPDNMGKHDGFLHYFLRRILYSQATGILVQTKLAETIELSQRRPHTRVIRFPNPIDIRPTPSSTPREPIILNAGRLVPGKNQVELLRIFSMIQANTWRLIFAGDGPDRNFLEAQARELGLENKVEFKGNVTDLRALMRRSKIFAFVSKSEGFPNALAEAMAEGMACISYNCEAGPSDMIEDGVNGFLVPSGDQKTFVERLTYLMQNPSIQKEMSSNAQGSIKRFSSETVLNDLAMKINPTVA